MRNDGFTEIERFFLLFIAKYVPPIASASLK